MPLTPDTLLDPYQLVSFIGAGGMGKVLGSETLEVSAAERLFDLSLASGANRGSLYAPAANGQKFLASVMTDGAMAPVTIWMNWMAGIGK